MAAPIKKWYHSIWPWSAFYWLERRIYDMEHMFTTKRDAKGTVVQTLADVDVKNRETKKVHGSTRGMSWLQRRTILEKTEGGRRPLEN